MSIASRIEAIEQHLTDDYSVLTLAGADLTSVNKNILNLKQTWQERLLYFMNNGTQVVWNNWNKVSGTGTSLTLNNTEEAPMSLTYKGNTQQSGTPTPSSPIPVQVVSGDNSIEVKGKNLFDYSSASDTNNTISGTYRLYEIKGLIPNEYYYLSGTTFNSALEGKYIYLWSTTSYPGNPSYLLVNPSEYHNEKLFYANDEGKIYLAIYPNDTTTWSTIIDYFKNCQIEKGTQATTYEAYKGASYPISLSSSNMFDKTQCTYGYRLDITGKDFLDAGYFISPFIEVKSSTQYTKNSPTADALHRTAFYTSNNENSVISIDSSNNTFTTPSSCKYLRFCGIINEVFTTQLNKGNVVLPYQEYFTPIQLLHIPNTSYYDKIDKSTGENLFDGEIEEGTISVSNGQNASSTTKFRSVNYIPVNPETTYYRLFNTTSSDGYLYYYDKNKTLLSTLWYNASTNGTFTTPANCYYLRFITPLNSNPLYMISLGNEVPVYEPYGTGWYLKKEIGKVVLNGSETWTNPGTNTSVYQYNTSFLSIALSTAYCTHAKQKLINSNIVSSIGNNEFVLQTPSGSTISILYFRNDTITGNVTNWKSWLSSNNVSVYYPLATPTYETITDTTLLSQLEALKKSYENVTNISQVNNDMPFELDVTALEEMN